MKDIYDLIVIGGGAAGFFCAIQCAKFKPGVRIKILEKSGEVLSKVRVSGGGRCNVTHACFDPGEMITFYPRGNKELLGPFHRFLCGDMMQWLADHGVETKIESDGRVFPVTDNSDTIIQCFLDNCRIQGVEISTRHSVDELIPGKDYWEIVTSKGNLAARNILVATGSSPSMWRKLKLLGHTIVTPIPSLFTFSIDHPLLHGLAGISLENTVVSLEGTGISQSGPILITHSGLSGPAILKLSAWGAPVFYERNYRIGIRINWANVNKEDVYMCIENMRKNHGGKKVISTPLLGIPRRLWQRMLEILTIHDVNFSDLKTEHIKNLSEMLTCCTLQIVGKNTNKEEFVTCGGIDTNEINFRTMESKLSKGLYFAGEVINIDAVTGGFNFQAAWTEATIAAQAITASL